MKLAKAAADQTLCLKLVQPEFPDALRAQYFLTSLQVASQRLFDFIATNHMIFSSPQGCCLLFFNSLIEELDQIVLPVIAYELAIANELGLLKGKSPESRYESFFVSGTGYSHLAHGVIQRYPPLFEMVDRVIDTAINSAIKCLTHLLKDLNLLKNNKYISEDDLVVSLDLLGDSDPHLGHRNFIVSFRSGRRIIHKSVDLTLDQLFATFLQKLDLPSPYDLLCLKALPRGHSYGWLAFTPYQACESVDQIRSFYRRAGVLIAVADALNYSDGHFENLIAVGEYPILIDGETFFQNYAIPQRGKDQIKNILATGLIQKPPLENMQMGYTAAFQAPPNYLFEVLYPFAMSDRTDKLNLHYRGLKNRRSHNTPSIGTRFFSVHHYINEVLDGFSFAFDHIKSRKVKFLADTCWWDQVGKSRSRTVLRDTLAYVYLIRRIQRPEACTSELTMRAILDASLGDTPYTAYEREELMQLNVPYFYHFPGQCNLYQGDGMKHGQLFLKSGIDCLKEQLRNWNEDYKILSLDILRKQLPLTPRQGEIKTSKILG